MKPSTYGGSGQVGSDFCRQSRVGSTFRRVWSGCRVQEKWPTDHSAIGYKRQTIPIKAYDLNAMCTRVVVTLESTVVLHTMHRSRFGSLVVTVYRILPNFTEF